MVADPATGEKATIAEVPGGEELVLEGERWTYPAFGLSSVLAARDSLVVYGNGERFEILVFRDSGKKLPSISLSRDRLPVTDSMRAAYRQELERIQQEFVRRRGGDPKVVQEGSSRAEIVFRDSVPAFGSLAVDRDFNIWVGEYVVRGRPPRRWTVLDIHGRLVSEVVLPPRFRLLDIGRDYVLGVATNEDDVERISMYRLNRSP